jgi:5-methylcytosine-specific restriction endonuclease McrA
MTRAEHCARSGRSSSWIRPNKRAQIYARDQYRCVWCLRRGVELTLDHFLPRALGGGNGADNLITCCSTCNSRRQHTPALTYAAGLGLLFGEGYEALDRCLDALARPLPVFVP